MFFFDRSKKGSLIKNARFIIEVPKYLSKTLPKLTTTVFKLMFKLSESYNKQSFFFSDVNTFWTVLNNQHATDTMKNLNRQNKPTSITCFGFLTPYSNTPNGKVMSSKLAHRFLF